MLHFILYKKNTAYFNCDSNTINMGGPMRNKICLALDNTIEEAENLAKRLSKWVGIFKIGSHLFATGEGKRIIDIIHKSGSEVFLDLKWHDIPTTVANAARVATNMGIS
jgi:orotidine-5'-phosphate decarboxylase